MLLMLLLGAVALAFAVAFAFAVAVAVTDTFRMGTSYKDVYGWPNCVRPVGSWVVERHALRPARMIFSLKETSAAIH